MISFSAGTEPGVESELIDLGSVAFTRLRELDDEALHQSLLQVVERTRRLRATYRSGNPTGGERID